MNSSTVIPGGLTREAAELWRAGTGDLEVKAGQLWTLAWDGELLGHVMVSSVKDDFFLGWPVTLPGEHSYSPGMIMESSLGVDVTVWPTRETGLGLHLLERSLGPLLDIFEIRRIAAGLDDDDDQVMSKSDGNVALPERNAISAAMSHHWADLCFHTGLDSSDLFFLDRSKVQAIGGSAREVADVLSLTPVAVRTFWDAEQGLPSESAAILFAHFGATAEQLGRQDPKLAWWHMLAAPTYKSEVEKACSERNEAETQIREEIAWSAFALAARQDGEALAEQKLRDAIRRTASKGR